MFSHSNPYKTLLSLSQPFFGALKKAGNKFGSSDLSKDIDQI